MYEKVNPSHPDKVADRIAGAIVDLAYAKQDNPKIAVEVLIGHGRAEIIIETSVDIEEDDITKAVLRIAGPMLVSITSVKQDEHLAKNQEDGYRCGDNGIFKGVPVTNEQSMLAGFAEEIYEKYPYDGKYIYDAGTGKLIICQSNAKTEDLKREWGHKKAIINPLGEWTGGTNVDTGATNRKLGSDMGDAVTGGGLHGKDLSKADVSANIFLHLQAQSTGRECKAFCAIGDDNINGVPYSEVVDIARQYVKSLGGFEKLAEWGLIR